MKPTIQLSLTLLLASLSSCHAQAQNREFREQVSREFTLTAEPGRSVLAVYNIDGPVRVQGTGGNKVVVEVTRTIRADNEADLELGKKEAVPGFLQRHDSIVAYMAGPYDSRPHENHGRHSNHRDIDYHYTFEYVIKVPSQMTLNVSTINNGAVTVQDVSGPLRAHNINGPVTLTNVKGPTDAATINGNVEAAYTSSPTGSCRYSTINGDITVQYPPDVAADVRFKSMHGELLTDFPNVENLPVQVVQTKEGSTGGTKYKLSKGTAVRLGKGGNDFRFETLNGDVTIKRRP
ncbi:DUF4097 family beta strand repeat-containing protein [Hymenobacter chitinivorans]|uniref:Adhesin domain-containing protein n=1 Tax=Hymenobacter chitinivorans DSM 11115 TaxID=1121954 RepID=A0A2M9BQI4_9BACT|nr:hypothetical protein [Hymenobacter chitinivorans]PJJ60209.1 hypothetical protein CLV45_1634 [Hymenobacter chitinivorans DSM 11115]